jgi:hypothetical protein
LLALTEAVDRFPRVHKNLNIQPYLHTCIRRRVSGSLHREALICVPERTKNHLLKKNGSVHYDVVEDQDIFDLISDEDFYSSSIAVQPDTSMEVEEMVQFEIDEDREIITFRMMGMGDEEIARALNLHVAYVFQRRKELISRLGFVLRKIR